MDKYDFKTVVPEDQEMHSYLARDWTAMLLQCSVADPVGLLKRIPAEHDQVQDRHRVVHWELPLMVDCGTTSYADTRRRCQHVQDSVNAEFFVKVYGGAHEWHASGMQGACEGHARGHARGMRGGMRGACEGACEGHASAMRVACKCDASAIIARAMRGPCEGHDETDVGKRYGGEEASEGGVGWETVSLIPLPTMFPNSWPYLTPNT